MLTRLQAGPARIEPRAATTPSPANQKATFQPITAPSPTADSLLFSGQAMKHLKETLDRHNTPESWYQFNKAEIDALLNRRVFPGVTGWMLLQAFMEDVVENKDGDGEVAVDEFIARASGQNSNVLKRKIAQYLNEACQLELLQNNASHQRYYKPTPLGQYVANLPAPHELF